MYSVYLVDDDSFILNELVNTIPWMDNGFTVIGSQISPQKALLEIEELKPDVVFTDLRMPAMDGNDLVKALKEKGVVCEFVMISAYDTFESVRAFFQQSGFDYILKPVQQEDIQLVLERLLNRISEKKPAVKTEETALSGTNPGFDSLVEYVNEHFNEKITLDLLSGKFGFSKNYICNLFSKYYNTSLTGYITDLRMAKAKELLKDKSRLMKDIGISLGYSEYYHFFKVFKDYYGISPKDMQNE